jgi:PAS domain S-box-containing protein
MFKGGPIYNHRAEQIVRYTELAVPILLTVYGLLVQFDIIKVSFKIDVTGFYLVMFFWLVIGVSQFFMPSKKKIDLTLRMMAYHLTVGAYLLFVTGVASPFIGGWIILLLLTYIFAQTRGIFYSIFAFAVFIYIDIAFWQSTNLSIIADDTLAFIIVLATGIIAINILRTQKLGQDKINVIQTNEFLQRDSVLAIINNLTDAVLSLDKDGIVRVYNAASLNLLDTNDSLNGQHIDEILPLFDKKSENVSIFKELKKIKTVSKRDDLSYSLSDGEIIRLEITYTPIHKSYSRTTSPEAHEGFVLIMRDVTKIKSLEEVRDEFISVISHELRTPLTIAEGTLSNVQIMMDHPNATKKMLKESIETAHDQIIFLSHMVNDLSTLSRAERGVSDNTEDIDVRELAHALHDKYASDAKAKKLHLDLDLSPKLGKVHVSRLYLEELLQNFLTNAIKYTKKGSITISFSENNKNILFEVKDTGIGLSKSDQTRIFEKFYRSEDYRTRETAGTGLGLYIAAKLAHKLGTKIMLTSRLNFGSTFSFALPITSEQASSEK